MPLEPISDGFDVNVEWEDVPESDLVPEGLYELVITKAELGWTRSEKLACEVTYQVGAGELEGSRLRPETFTLGSEQDNQGLMAETRRVVFGWQNLKRLCNAVGVRYEQSLKVTLRDLQGRRFLAQVKVQTQPAKNRDGSENQYAGNQQNRVSAYYPVGHGPQASASQALAQGSHSISGGNGSHVAPQPQRRMSAAEALAASQGLQGGVEEIPGDHDIPF